MLDAAIEKVADSNALFCPLGSRSPLSFAGVALAYKRCKADPLDVAQRMLARQCSLRRFFGRLETELFYPRDWQATTVDQFIEIVDSYIRWYNEKRNKISLGTQPCRIPCAP